MLDTLINKYLPDFTKVKISKEEAAEQHSSDIGENFMDFLWVT